MEPRSGVQTAAVFPYVLVLATFFAAASAALFRRVPAIYVFGDSTADVGNNNDLPFEQRRRANYPHNGIDYPGGTPTGRFSNGYIGVDFLAMKMGFKESPPAYFGPRRCGFGGVNFASGGSGIFDATSMNKSYTLNAQISFFQQRADELTRFMGRPWASSILSKSIFILSIASNDIFQYYIASRQTTVPPKEEFISSLSDQFTSQLAKLYCLGARKFVVFGSGLLGCAPFLRAANPSGECVDELNQLSLRFNDAMRTKLQDLSCKSPNLMYSYINTFNISLQFSLNPSSFGFKVLGQACCGGGRLRAESICVPNATFCENRDEYPSWDYVHPTQAAYRVIADFAYGGSKNFAHPINVQDLIDAYT